MMVALTVFTPDRVSAAALSSPWTADKPETSARLVAGAQNGALVAGIEMRLAAGWKTYWRFPGDAGGIPPRFDWAGSDNLATATVLYPAPQRTTDRTGDTLGYADAVTFPVRVTAGDPTRPVTLRLRVEYGVCREVCIPVEAALTLEVPALEASSASPPALPATVAAALDRVPRTGDARRPDDPRLLAARIAGTAERPVLELDAAVPGGAMAGVDAYVEGTDDAYIPLAKRGGTAIGPDRVRFEIDLTGASELTAIRGRPATVTLVSPRGLSETRVTLD